MCATAQVSRVGFTVNESSTKLERLTSVDPTKCLSKPRRRRCKRSRLKVKFLTATRVREEHSFSPMHQHGCWPVAHKPPSWSNSSQPVVCAKLGYLKQMPTNLLQSPTSALKRPTGIVQGCSTVPVHDVAINPDVSQDGLDQWNPNNFL